MGRSSTRKFDTFSRTEKIKLIKAVQQHDCLWNLKCKKYGNNSAVKSAWKTVGTHMKKDPYECKSCWRSLRDSLRYHRSKVPKDGSADEDSISWEYAQYMDFIPNLPSARTTYINQLTENTQESDRTPSPCSTPLVTADSERIIFVSEDTVIFNESEPSTTNSFTFQSNQSKTVKMDKSRYRDQNLVARQRDSPPRQRPVLAYWNQLLNELPEDAARDAEEQITDMLHRIRRLHWLTLRVTSEKKSEIYY